MEYKSLNFEYRDHQWHMSVVLKDTEEPPYFVLVDILPPDGEARVMARPIHQNGNSFQDALIGLRKANSDYCDQDVWDDMEKTCVMADNRRWDTNIDSSIMHKGEEAYK